MRALPAVFAVFGVFALGACRTGSPAEPPAYIVRPTAESRLALSQAVGKALADPGIVVDPDALTGNGVLVIEGAQRPDPKRLVLGGRDPAEPHGTPERFHLVKVGEHCVLIHDRTDRRYELIGTVCEPR